MQEPREYKTLYGCRSANTCAYCWKHYRALTPKQLKRKECLRKQCAALERFEHPYWELRDKKKVLRAARKERLESAWSEVSRNQIRT